MKRYLTQVVNVRSGLRYDVYVGRPGHGEEGWLGNEVGKYLPRAEAIAAFKVDFLARLRAYPAFRSRVDGILDKPSNPIVLACFCAPGQQVLTATSHLPYICHGQLIAEYLDRRANE